TAEGQSGPTTVFPFHAPPDVAGIGAFVSDGAGNAAGTFVGNPSGSFTQSYSVKSDCTGSFVSDLAGSGFKNVQADFVIAGDGEMYAVVTSLDYSSACTGCPPFIDIISHKLKKTDATAGQPVDFFADWSISTGTNNPFDSNWTRRRSPRRRNAPLPVGASRSL